MAYNYTKSLNSARMGYSCSSLSLSRQLKRLESEECSQPQILINNTIKSWLLVFLNRSQEAFTLACQTLLFKNIEISIQAELNVILAHSAFDLTQFPVSVQYANSALKLLDRDKDNRLHTVACLWLGAAKTQQSNYIEASELLNNVHERALKQKEPYFSAVALNYLAIIQEELGNMDEALGIYDKAIKYARLAEDSNILGRILANIGEAYVNIEMTREGILHLTEAELHLKVTRDKDLVSWCKMSMARAYEIEGKFDLAESLFRKAIRMTRHSKNGRTHAENLVAFGQFMLARGRHIVAKRSLTQALEIVKKIPIEREIFKTHFALSELFEKTKRYALAFEHFKAFYQVRSKLWDEAASIKIERLQKAFELDHAKQQREIERLRNVELATANKKLAKQAVLLKEIAIRDALTTLFNRRHMWELMAQEEKNSLQSYKPLSIAFVDIDHFKAINDNFSHAIGDDTLVAIAKVLKKSVRQKDCVARWGGEEFVILFVNTNLDEAEQICEFIREKVESFNWSNIQQGLSVTASFGVAQLTQDQNIEETLNVADELLYLAKQTGRNKVVKSFQ